MSEASDLLKYVTGRVATYLTTPAEPRDKESERRSVRLPWTSQLFGTIVPMGVQLWWGQRRREKPHVPGT